MLDNLELVPYQYKDNIGYNDALTIDFRVVLTEAQYSDLGKLPIFVKVVRNGIDKEPREMKLVEVAWSKNNNEIKEQIGLFDKEDKPKLPWLHLIESSARFTAKQSLIIDELLKALVSKNVLNNSDVDEIKSKITSDNIWEKRRELNNLGIDLDEFESIEDE